MLRSVTRFNGKSVAVRPNGNQETASKVAGGQVTDMAICWLTCGTCHELVPVMDKTVNGWQNQNVMVDDMVHVNEIVNDQPFVTMNDADINVNVQHDVTMNVVDINVNGQQNVMMNDVDLGIVSFICRHCKWEQSQSDIVERLVSIEKVGIRLSEENIERSNRISKIEENNRKLEELLNDITIQLTQESANLHSRADRQDNLIEALQWRTSINSEEMQSTWPKLDSVAVPVVSTKKVEIVQSTASTSGQSKIRCKSKLPKFIKKAQQVKKQNKNKTITVVEMSATKETEVESVNDSPNVSETEVKSVSQSSSVPEIDKQKQAVNISFEQLCKDKKEGTVLLIGDSLARGVGYHLKSQHGMFESRAFGGARIEDITKKVEVMKDLEESHIVVLVGTNNLQSDGTTMIMNKYKDLVNQLKAKRFRKISILGILARNDLSNYNNSKRIAMNIQLKELCKKNRVDFLEIAVDKESMLDRRGLHLNFSGQDKVARSIFKHSVSYLN